MHYLLLIFLSDTHYLGDLWYYSEDHGNWTSVSPTFLPSARSGSCGYFWRNDLIFLFGGFGVGADNSMDEMNITKVNTNNNDNNTLLQT